jgi:hypothetical protein
LEKQEGQRLVHFKLRRFWNGLDRSATLESSQEYRSLAYQAVFFESGTFCKGSPQVAQGTGFGAEFSFVAEDRRHRSPAGPLDGPGRHDPCQLAGARSSPLRF